LLVERPGEDIRVEGILGIGRWWQDDYQAAIPVEDLKLMLGLRPVVAEIGLLVGSSDRDVGGGELGNRRGGESLTSVRFGAVIRR
jgi:hypothetical protein